METYQTDPNATHYTNEELRCALCNKSVHYVIEVKWEEMFCLNCYVKNFLHILKWREFVEVRGIINPNKSKQSKKIQREKMNYSLRYKIIKRDNFKCVLCGDCDRLEIDHKIPISEWWKTSSENLQTLCFRCNRGKSNQL